MRLGGDGLAVWVMLPIRKAKLYLFWTPSAMFIIRKVSEFSFIERERDVILLSSKGRYISFKKRERK